MTSNYPLDLKGLHVNLPPEDKSTKAPVVTARAHDKESSSTNHGNCKQGHFDDQIETTIEVRHANITGCQIGDNNVMDATGDHELNDGARNAQTEYKSTQGHSNITINEGTITQSQIGDNNCMQAPPSIGRKSSDEPNTPATVIKKNGSGHSSIIKIFGGKIENSQIGNYNKMFVHHGSKPARQPEPPNVKEHTKGPGDHEFCSEFTYALVLYGQANNALDKDTQTFKRDAELFYKVLTHPDAMRLKKENVIKIELKAAGDKTSIFTEIQKRIKQNGHTEKKINLIFYYSGHAIANSCVFSVSPDLQEYLNASEIKDNINKLNPTRTLFILDCCGAAAIKMNIKGDTDTRDFYCFDDHDVSFPKLWNFPSNTKTERWSRQWSSCTNSQTSSYTGGGLSIFTEYICKGMCSAQSLCHISVDDKSKTCPGCKPLRPTNKLAGMKLCDLEVYITNHVSTKGRRTDQESIQDPVMEGSATGQNIVFMKYATTRLLYEIEVTYKYSDYGKPSGSSEVLSKLYYCKDEIMLQSAKDLKDSICNTLKESYMLPNGFSEFLKYDHLQLLQPDMLSVQKFFDENEYETLKVHVRNDMQDLKEDMPVTVLFDNSVHFNELCNAITTFVERSQGTCVTITRLSGSQTTGNREEFVLKATPPYAREECVLQESNLFSELLNGAYSTIKKAPSGVKYMVKISLDKRAMAAEFRVRSKIIKR